MYKKIVAAKSDSNFSRYPPTNELSSRVLHNLMWNLTFMLYAGGREYGEPNRIKYLLLHYLDANFVYNFMRSKKQTQLYKLSVFR